MKYRLRAFSLHLFISFFLVGIALFLILSIWYPAPLLKATGALSIAGLIFSVDVIVGPLLTGIVYKKNKKSLVFDLSVIFLLQVIAFGYGAFTLAEGRPVWLVFNVDRFDLVAPVDIDYRRRSEIRPEFLSPSFFGPVWVAARAPLDAEERNTLTFESVIHGIDLPQRPDLYLPINEEVETISKAALPLSDLNQFNTFSEVETRLTLWPKADAYLPLNASAASMTVLLKKDTAEIIAIVDLSPW